MIKYGFNLNYWFNEHNLDLHRALDEISVTGWQGVELVRDQLEYFYDEVDYFKRLVRLHNLEITSYYCEFSLIYEDRKYNEIENMKRKCDFLKKMGCNILLIDGGIKDPHRNNKKYYDVAIENIDEIGNIAKNLGLETSWHQHWGSMFDTNETLCFLLDNTDPKMVGFCPDTAHLLISEMNPTEIIKKYKDRINYIHFKDIIPNNFLINRKNIVRKLDAVNEDEVKKGIDGFPKYEYSLNRFNDNGAYHINSKFKFTEVGRGIVDFESICKIIKKIDYNGWIVVDQDYTEWPYRESLDINLRNIKYFMDL